MEPILDDSGYFWILKYRVLSASTVVRTQNIFKYFSEKMSFYSWKRRNEMILGPILSFDQIHDHFLERGKSGGWKTSHACNIWFLSCEIEFSIKKIYFSWIVNKLIKIATLKSLISMEFFLFFLRKISQLHALFETPLHVYSFLVKNPIYTIIRTSTFIYFWRNSNYMIILSSFKHFKVTMAVFMW